MHHSPHKYSTPSIAITCIFCLLLIAGCDEKYKPAAYKAAPRVDVGSPSGGSATPDVTKWTSPKAIRNLPNANRTGGYRGDAYRGFGNRGYSGMARGYRGLRSYRGDGKSAAYRGYGVDRSYRGNTNKPGDSYRGYRRQ